MSFNRARSDGLLTYFKPFSKISDGLGPPAHFTQQVVHDVAIVNSLHSEASSDHCGVLHIPRLERPGVEAVLPSEHPQGSSKCVDHVEDEGLAVVGLGPGVLLSVGGVQVQQEHLAPGDSGEISLHLLLSPPRTEEQPALHHPDRLGVSRGHGLVHSSADTGQVLH